MGVRCEGGELIVATLRKNAYPLSSCLTLKTSKLARPLTTLSRKHWIYRTHQLQISNLTLRGLVIFSTGRLNCLLLSRKVQRAKSWSGMPGTRRTFDFLL